MDVNSEQVLIIYSASATSAEDLAAAQGAIRSFVRTHLPVQVRPRLFDIPQGAAPGSTLGTELSEVLRASIGAVVFIDDLRPNVAYEVGFFHGQRRTVLLLTRAPVDSVWTAISDLAGAALASLDRQDLHTAVHQYLTRLYDDLGLVEPFPSTALPTRSSNYLNKVDEQSALNSLCQEGGPWGATLKVSSWQPIDIHLGNNILPGARFRLILRSLQPGADFNIYHRVLFSDREGIRRRMWLGLTSRKYVTRMTSEERILPAQALTAEWRMFVGRFQDLLRLGAVLGSGPPEFLETVRFRAGISTTAPKPVSAYEVGYLSYSGID